MPLLGQIPLQAGAADLGDSGAPVIVAQPDSPAAIALRSIAEAVRKRAGRSVSLPILTG